MIHRIGQNLNAINPAFQVKVISLPWPDLLDDVGARRMPVYVGGWREDYHHPHNWVQPYLHSEGAFGWYQSFPPDMAAAFDAITLEPVGLRYQVWLETKKPANLRPDVCSLKFYAQHEAELADYVMQGGEPRHIDDRLRAA